MFDIHGQSNRSVVDLKTKLHIVRDTITLNQHVLMYIVLCNEAQRYLDDLKELHKRKYEVSKKLGE